MESYGVAQSRETQMKARKSASLKMGAVFFVLAFLGWIVGRIHFDVITPVWALVLGSLILWGLYFSYMMYDMRKINDEQIYFLSHFGKENTKLTDCINASLDRNGCISRFDLKSIQYEIWLHNQALKSDLENPHKNEHSKGISGWGEYHFNEQLIDKIDQILGK